MARGGGGVCRKGRGGGLRGRRARRKLRNGSDDDDDEDDEEYVLGEDEDCVESDDEDEALFDSEASKEGSCDSGGDGSEEEDEEDDEFIDTRSRKGNGVSTRIAGRARVRRKSGQSRVLKEEVEEEEEESLKRRRRRTKTRGRLRSGVFEGEDDEWRAEEDEEEEEGDDDDDDDFTLDEEESDEDELLCAPNQRSVVVRRKGSVVKNGRKGKRKGRKARVKKQAKEKVRAPIRKKRRRLLNKADDDHDDDFVLEDEVFVEDKNCRERRVRNNRRRRMRSSTVHSDSTDSDSSDFDYTIPGNEVVNLLLGRASNCREQEIKMESKVKLKGKGKQIEDSGKQICGICLSEEHKGVIQGLLNSCTHFFCFACIMEWSKVESKCPVCKQRFTTITKSSLLEGDSGIRTSVIRVPKRDQVYQPSEEEVRGYFDPYENVVCIECHHGGDDNLMLLCDLCDSPAHTYCVGLGNNVPEGNWYCDVCRSAELVGSNLQECNVMPGHVDEVGDHDSLPGQLFDRSVPEAFDVSVLCEDSHLQGIDLASPRSFSSVQARGPASQTSNVMASTLSGRRTIQRRIRILLSNNRVRAIQEGSPRINMGHIAHLENGICCSEVSQRLDSSLQVEQNVPHVTSGIGMFREEAGQSNAAILSCTYNDGDWLSAEGDRLSAEGAKEEVHSLVKYHLKHIMRDTTLDHSAFKKIARQATHTILAACGIKHRQRVVVHPIQTPPCCSHIEGAGAPVVVAGCCTSCFDSFVRCGAEAL